MRSKTWTQAGRFSAILIAAAAFSACSSDDDVKTLKETHTEPASENCEYGGKVHISGQDLDGDGVLSSDEIESRTYDCDDDPSGGETGGTERLTETHVEPAGDNCEFGGERTVTGIDKNKDGDLSFSEIDNTSYDCNEDPDPQLPEGERLTEVSSIGSTADCVNGGQEIVSGIDADESGDLQEAEIDSRSYLCAGESPGGTVVDIEILPVGDATCADGGKIIHSGEDANDDGVLQEDERENAVTLCEPVDGACDGVAAIQVESAQIGPDLYWGHSEGDVYPIRVRLSRALDEASLQVIQFDEAFGPDADFTGELSADDADLVLANWEAVQGDVRDGSMLIADDCGMVIATVELPSVTGANTGVRVMLEYQEYAEGDDYHFCWESRNADACELTQHSGGPARPVDAEGCDFFVLDEDNFQNDSISGMMITCSEPGSTSVSTSLNQQTVPSISGYSMLNSRFFPGGGGELQLRWIGNHVDDCEVVTPDGRFPSDEAIVEDAFFVPIKSSGYISIECKDANDDVVSRRFSSPVVVGAGVMSFNGHISEANGDVSWSVNLATYFLDGACDVSLTRGEFTFELTDVEPESAANNPPYERRHYEHGVVEDEGGSFDEEDPLHAEIRCSNADGSNEQVLTYTN